MSAIVPFQEMQSMAEAIAASGLFGMKDKNSVLALMAVAQSEGLHPATAARDFHIIQGRPALKADAMLSRFQAAGGKVEWKDYTDERVTGLFSHPNGGELAVTWTIEQAQRIGLVKPGSGWQKFPRAMLRSRCISEGIRSVFPGSVTGFYSPEEVSDFEPPPKDLGKVDEVTGEISVATELADIVEDFPSTPKVPGVGNISSMIHQHHLYVPGNDQPYASYFSLEDWIAGFCDLIERIEKSDKFDRKEKNHKYELLRRSNDQFTRTWSGAQTAKFLTAVQKIRSM
jgi:RecT family